MKAILLLLLITLIACETAGAQGFYCNTKGGSYYHADPRCDSMDRKYWDSLEEINIDQVEELGLRGPCMRCIKEEKVLQNQTMPVSASSEFSIEGRLVFGGSKLDQVNDLAVAPNGRIIMAGYTCSSDGTLSDRTKSGRSGWVSMVDQTGKTYWNFCSRHGSADTMMAPVAHEDGSITVLLCSLGHEYNQVEWIRLDNSGNMMDRKPLIRTKDENASCGLEKVGIFSDGYVISSYENRYDTTYHWFDFNGNLLFRVEGLGRMGVQSVSKNHVIMVIDGSYWLCALDAKGNRVNMTKLCEEKRNNNVYTDLVSLPDGGAMASRVLNNESQFYDSCIQCWDRQGNLVFEFPITDFRTGHVFLEGEQIIIHGERQDEEGYLLFMDSSGSIIKELKLGSVHFYGHTVIMDEKGRIIAGKKIDGGANGAGNADRDVELDIVNVY